MHTSYSPANISVAAKLVYSFSQTLNGCKLLWFEHVAVVCPPFARHVYVLA